MAQKQKAETSVAKLGYACNMPRSDPAAMSARKQRKIRDLSTRDVLIPAQEATITTRPGTRLLPTPREFLQQGAASILDGW